MLSIDEAIECERNHRLLPEYHEQLAGWLEELKAYIEIGTVEECRNSVLDIPKAYNKGIDDLMEKVSECFISDADWNYLIQEAKQLKAGIAND